jgi:hypothetical protein
LLQLSLQRDFAAAVNVDDRGTVRKLLGNGNRAPRKVLLKQKEKKEAGMGWGKGLVERHR